MLKRDITYEDFNGHTVTETFYFHLSKPELIELELDIDGGFTAFIQKIMEAKKFGVLVKEFKKIVLLAYGQKSDDGKRFVKNDKLREEFSQTAAYNALFMELATDEDAAATFIKGVMPQDMVAQVDRAMADVPLPDAVPAPAPPSPPQTS